MKSVSKTSNAQIMTNAREALKGKWGIAIGGMLLYSVITGSLSSAFPLSLILGGPLAVGLAIFSLNLYRKKDVQLEQLFDGFKNFSNALIAYLLAGLYILLWTLLLIVPGIVAALSYSQVMFILAEDNKISPTEALKKSKQMMMGNKWKLFCLGWRFFGWLLLSILTLGIGLLWLMPYMQVSYAGFYEDIKNTK